MEALDFKQNFLIAAFISSVLENSDKQFLDSNMNFINSDQLGFDDNQKDAMIVFVKNFEKYCDSLLGF